MCHRLTLPGSSAAAVSYPVKIKKNMTTFPYFVLRLWQKRCFLNSNDTTEGEQTGIKLM